MYEGGLRVPSLVEWPGRVKAGSVSEVMTGTIDYFPTVAELLDISSGDIKNRQIDGVSLMPVIEGRAKQRVKPMFFGYRRIAIEIDGQAIMIDNRYKLLRRATREGNYELYDLIEDPGEKHDLSKDNPSLFEKMKKELDAYVDSCIQSYLGTEYLI